MHTWLGKLAGLVLAVDCLLLKMQRQLVNACAALEGETPASQASRYCAETMLSAN